MRNVANNNKSFNLTNKRKKKRQSQIAFLIFSLLIIITALVFAVSKIGQNQDNRQQAWDGPGDPYVSETSPTEFPDRSSDETSSFDDCANGVMTAACGQYLDSCMTCVYDLNVCEGCAEYRDLLKKCSGLSGLLGFGGKNCDLIEDYLVPTPPPKDATQTQVSTKKTIPTEAAPKDTTPTEVPQIMTSEPMPTEVPEDSLKVKTKIYLLDLIGKL